MKTLLKILYILLFVVLAILLTGLFLPRNIRIEADTVIESSCEIVFDQVNTLRSWESWSPWMSDSMQATIEYNEVPAGKGADFRWKEKDSETGSIKITESNPGQEILMHIDFGEGGDAAAIWKFKPEGDKIKVSWVFENKDMGYFERYFMFLFKKNIQKDLEKGLTNLKAVCSDLRLSRISEIEVNECEAQPAMIIIDSTLIQDMDTRMKENFKKLSAYLERRGIKPDSDKIALFFKWNPDGLSTFASGYRIPEKTWGFKEYTYYELPAGKTASVTHWGKYDSEKPYIALDNYLESHGLKQGNMIWEEYLVVPENETDTSLWEKRIYYPVEP